MQRGLWYFLLIQLTDFSASFEIKLKNIAWLVYFGTLYDRVLIDKKKIGIFFCMRNKNLILIKSSNEKPEEKKLEFPSFL